MPRGSFCRCAGLSGGDFFDALPGGGGILSEEGSSECLFISPSGWVCSAGLLFLRGKSRQKRASPLRAGSPLFWPNRTLQNFDSQLPLKFRWVADPLVIGAVDIQLRLSPLGLRGASFLLTRTCAVSRKAQEVPHRSPASPVPSKGRQAKLDKIPAGDQMPAAEFQRLRTVKT